MTDVLERREVTVARWIATVHYRADAGLIDVQHDLIELEELHDLVERGPHWDTIDRIEIVRADGRERGLTLEEARGAMIAAPFICQVASITDGDTWRCADGRRVRLAGVDANELDGSCHLSCAPMSAQQARVWLDRLIYRQRLSCVQLGTSYRRIVARCSVNGVDLSCASVASGAAVRWERYWSEYRMGRCG